VLSIDDTLLSHYGQEFEEITKLYDPVTDSYVWAHNLVTLHYSDDQTDYPLAFQLWKPVKLEKLEAGMRAAGIDFPPEKEAWKTSDPRKWRLYLRRAWTRRLKKYPQLSALYETKLDIAKALLRQWLQIHPDEQQVVTFDDWYTEAEFCQYIDQELHLAYVELRAMNYKLHRFGAPGRFAPPAGVLGVRAKLSFPALLRYALPFGSRLHH
jgi:hypothetical protein